MGCIKIADDAAALAHIQAARAAFRVEDAEVIWQRLPWEGVRRVMAPGAPDEQWTWLHRLAFRSELTAVRMLRAWQLRQNGWSAAVCALALLLGGVQLHGYLSPHVVCPRLDNEGEWFWDICVA